MKVKIKIDKDYEKPLCVIYTSEVSDEINEYLKLLSKSSEKTLTGRNGEDIVIIKPDEINNIHGKRENFCGNFSRRIQRKHSAV